MITSNLLPANVKKIEPIHKTSQYNVKRQHQTIILVKAIIIIQIGGSEAIALTS